MGFIEVSSHPRVGAILIMGVLTKGVCGFIEVSSHPRVGAILIMGVLLGFMDVLVRKKVN